MSVDQIASYLEYVAIGFSLLGILIILIGGFIAFYQYLTFQMKLLNIKNEGYNITRQQFVQKILLGLDFLVGADLIRTIAIPSFAKIGELAAIVAIRTVFSYVLGREVKET